MQNTTHVNHRNYKYSQWSNEELSKLERDYNSGKRLKVIADELGRSLSAVNKFISRSGLRKNGASRKRQTSFIKRESPNNNTNLKNCQHKINKYKQRNSSFEDVVKYLISKGYCISEYNGIIKNGEEAFLLFDKPINKLQLLLIANKLRLEENLPVFLVNNLIVY